MKNHYHRAAPSSTTPSSTYSYGGGFDPYRRLSRRPYSGNGSRPAGIPPRCALPR